MDIRSFRDLNVYQNSFEAALEIYIIEVGTWNELNEKYEIILGQLVKMINKPEKWCLPK